MEGQQSKEHCAVFCKGCEAVLGHPSSGAVGDDATADRRTAENLNPAGLLWQIEEIQSPVAN